MSCKLVKILEVNDQRFPCMAFGTEFLFLSLVLKAHAAFPLLFGSVRDTAIRQLPPVNKLYRLRLLKVISENAFVNREIAVMMYV